MIAYHKIWRKNLFIQQEADMALEQNCITKEERNNISLTYPSVFYTPNLFIRIGMFILTKIVLSFSFGLIALVFISVIQQFAGGLAVFFGLMACLALEYMVRTKRHYQSGVDDALLWGAAIALFCGISLPYNLSDLENAVLIFIITLLSMIRYADRIMAAICFISFLCIIFFSCTQMGGIVKTILPFIIMGVSFFVYFVARKINDPKTFNEYAGCFVIIEIVSLLTLYIAGNYWVVRELSNTMFGLNLKPGESIPFGFVFWIFTLAIPFVYLFRGIQKKNVVLIRVSLLLVAATVFTFRYYHAILVPEVAMLIAGLVLIIFAWVCTRYLHTPKYGFTKEELGSGNMAGNMHIESLIVAQTFSQQQQTNDGTQFGGGSFGGGGASGDF